ncbi:hypothetical protein AX279_20900 [Pseudomonas sp. J237]|nr:MULTISPECIES: glycosyltransferase family 4 protein [Pseudomonas]OEO24269.1 hypothetical protein AX279_20900 [Pseudomonas sp. J237]
MTNVLFIYRGLQVGGIETFYCRMAEKYQRDRFKFSFLFMCEREDCDLELLARLEHSADVFFYSDFISPTMASVVKALPIPIKIFFGISPKAFDEFIGNTDIVHVTEGLGILLAHHLFRNKQPRVKVNVGFYHQKEFSWGVEQNLPYFERMNRTALRSLNSKNLAFFNEGVADKVCAETGHEIGEVNVFPLGVDIANEVRKHSFNVGERIRIISIGRLTNFKTYNLWMIDVVSELVRRGVDVTYDIYGRGDMEGEVINRLSLLDVPVKLKGTLNYSEFKNVAVEYDLFIGSGTAIIEASALGIPAIIGIESIAEPMTYGYFSRVPGFTYNEKGLDLPLYEVVDMLENFVRLSLDEKLALGGEHFSKAKIFSMDACIQNFSKFCEGSVQLPIGKKFYNWYLYRFSYLLTSVISKFFKTSYAEKYN